MRNKSLSPKELSGFFSQVALILDAGIPLYDALETLADSEKEGENATVYRGLADRFNQSGSLADAMGEDGVWPEYVCSMTEIGERAGKLEQVMRGLSSYYDREDRIRSAVRNAVTYPLTLGVMLVVIVLIILWKVVPVFNTVLGTMGIGAGTRESGLIRAGSIVGWTVLILVAVLLIGFVAVLLLRKTRARHKVDRFLMKVFKPIRVLTKKLSAARVASVLSMLLEGGFPMGEATRMAAAVLPDAAARHKVAAMTEKLEQGIPFAEALEGTRMFEPTHLRMIRTGITAGREAEMMEKVAAVYEEQAEDTITKLLSIIEPTLVALLAVVIGAVLLSVMLPMAGVMMSLLG